MFFAEARAVILKGLDVTDAGGLGLAIISPGVHVGFKILLSSDLLLISLFA